MVVMGGGHHWLLTDKSGPGVGASIQTLSLSLLTLSHSAAARKSWGHISVDWYHSHERLSLSMLLRVAVAKDWPKSREEVREKTVIRKLLAAQFGVVGSHTHFPPNGVSDARIAMAVVLLLVLLLHCSFSIGLQPGFTAFVVLFPPVICWSS